MEYEWVELPVEAAYLNLVACEVRRSWAANKQEVTLDSVMLEKKTAAEREREAKEKEKQEVERVRAELIQRMGGKAEYR